MRKTLSVAAIIVLGCFGMAFGRGDKDPLAFPKENFTVKTMRVRTSNGEKSVTYRSYRQILYVTRPVDRDYQSLDVRVPVKIDAVSIDATNAPILFANGVGGYLSASNARGDRQEAGEISGREDMALAAGYVVVLPGCRGRDNKAADGTYFGKAPAAIVDLKAAIRYLKHNKGAVPGNVDMIISSGCSAGGGLSALIGASGNSRMSDAYFKEIGAADGSDDVYACACYSPIMDLGHDDMAYEWEYGTVPTRGGKLVDQELSELLKTLFVRYQGSLDLRGRDGFGAVTADNCLEYLLKYYLFPSADRYLTGLTEERRSGYLSDNRWITWKDGAAKFGFRDYLLKFGRLKGLPAFDSFEKRSPENSLFGDKDTEARHFTSFSLGHETGDKNAAVGRELDVLLDLMNPMYFLTRKNPGCAGHWWIRQGTGESGISQTVFLDLAVSLENMNRDVNARFFWDAGHCVDEDPEGFVKWMDEVTGYVSPSAHAK